MRQRNADFVDRHLDLERRVRRIRPESEVTLWESLMPYLADNWHGSSGSYAPAIRLNHGKAEMRGMIWPDLDHGGASIFVLADGGQALPAKYRPPLSGVTADIFLALDDDSYGLFDYYPTRGGWEADVTVAGHIFLTQAPTLVNTLVSPPVLVHPGSGATNFGWPTSGTQIFLDLASWVVETDGVDEGSF